MNLEHMRAAIRLASEHMLSGDGGPFGAVVVRDGTCVQLDGLLLVAPRPPQRPIAVRQHDSLITGVLADQRTILGIAAAIGCHFEKLKI